MIFGTRTSARLSALAALLGALCCQAASAQWGLPELMQHLAQRGAHDSRFIEEKRSDLLDQALILEGTLYYAPPARLDKRVESPRTETYSARGDSLVITRAEAEPLQIDLAEHPALRAFISALRDILAGNLEALEAQHRLILTGSAAQWHLKLLPRHRPLSTHVLELRIQGSGGIVNTFEVYEASGDSSVLRMRP